MLVRMQHVMRSVALLLARGLAPVQMLIWGAKQPASSSPLTCNARRRCSMKSSDIWNFCTALFSGSAGTMQPLCFSVSFWCSHEK